MQKTTVRQKLCTVFLSVLLILFIVVDAVLFLSWSVGERRAKTAVSGNAKIEDKEETEQEPRYYDEDLSYEEEKGFYGNLNDLSLSAGDEPPEITGDMALAGELKAYEDDDYDD